MALMLFLVATCGKEKATETQSPNDVETAKTGGSMASNQTQEPNYCEWLPLVTIGEVCGGKWETREKQRAKDGCWAAFTSKQGEVVLSIHDFKTEGMSNAIKARERKAAEGQENPPLKLPGLGQQAYYSLWPNTDEVEQLYFYEGVHSFRFQIEGDACSLEQLTALGRRVSEHSESERSSQQ
jgi:hypothetical protein